MGSDLISFKGRAVVPDRRDSCCADRLHSVRFRRPGTRLRYATACKLVALPVCQFEA